MGSPVDDLLWLSRPSRALDTHEMGRVHKHCEVLASMLESKMLRFVQEHQHQPLMEHFLSDSTPYTTRERDHIDWLEYSVTRSAKECKDYLTQRLFVSNADGNVVTFFREPREMENKTHLVSYAGMVELWPGLRLAGAQNIVISVYVFDRAVQAPMETRIQQRMAALDLHLQDEYPDTWVELSLMSWTICLGCGIHDMHGGLKWAVMEYIGDKNLMKDAWVVLQSLRQGGAQVYRVLREWVADVLKYEDNEGDDLTPWYEHIGVEEAWLPLFTELQVRWEDGFLKVSASFETNPSGTQPIVAALFHIWQFPRWNEARWCSLGKTAKKVMGALHTGLEHLVTRIMNTSREIKFYIQGFRRLSPRIRRFMAVIASTSSVSEAPLAMIREDDRLALRYPEIIALMDKHAHEALHLPSVVLKILCEHGQVSTSTLLDDNMQSVTVQLAYIRLRVKFLEEEPWTLCRGDVVSNLEALRQRPEPAGEVPKKIHRLLMLGHSPETLAVPVKMLENISFSTKSVEDPHSDGNRLMKMHPDYGRESLASRCFVKNAAPLFHRSQHDVTEQRLIAKLRKLTGRRFDKIRGRHMYCRALISRGKQKKSEGHIHEKNYSKLVIQRHGKRWKETSYANRKLLEDEAVAFAAEKRSENQKKIAGVLAKVREVRKLLRAHANDAGPVTRIDRCRFSSADMEEYAALFKSEEFVMTEVNNL